MSSTSRNEGAAVLALNRLARCALDAGEAYSLAAGHAADAELKQVLAERAAQCQGNAAELQYEVKALGGAPAQGDPSSSLAHRGWLKVVGLITDPGAVVLDEVERGEAYSEALYAEALRARLPPTAREVVARQQGGVRARREDLRRLRERFRSAA